MGANNSPYMAIWQALRIVTLLNVGICLTELKFSVSQNTGSMKPG